MLKAWHNSDVVEIRKWLASRGIERILVVSPHLDDAVFSLAGFLSMDDLPPCEVITVFTAAGPETSQDHALSAGFNDTAEEYATRQKEDRAAMLRLGLPFKHVGAEQGRLEDETAALTANAFPTDTDPERLLVLLPLGAGAKLGPAKRFLRRILRMPAGCDVHHEHLWVRDHIGQRVKDNGAWIGYYAEVPYQWANTPATLQERATELFGVRPIATSIAPDIECKYLAILEYASQVNSEFGTRESYRKRTASIAERLYLPRCQDRS